MDEKALARFHERWRHLAQMRRDDLPADYRISLMFVVVEPGTPWWVLTWMRRCAEVEEFIRTRGHPPRDNTGDARERSLWEWCRRQMKARSRLSRYQNERMSVVLGDRWCSTVDRWATRMFEIADWIDAHGGRRPQRHAADPIEDRHASWLDRQLARCRAGLLSADQRDILEQVALRVPRIGRSLRAEIPTLEP